VSRRWREELTQARLLDGIIRHTTDRYIASTLQEVSILLRETTAQFDQLNATARKLSDDRCRITNIRDPHDPRRKPPGVEHCAVNVVLVAWPFYDEAKLGQLSHIESPMRSNAMGS